MPTHPTQRDGVASPANFLWSYHDRFQQKKGTDVVSRQDCARFITVRTRERGQVVEVDPRRSPLSSIPQETSPSSIIGHCYSNCAVTMAASKDVDAPVVAADDITKPESSGSTEALDDGVTNLPTSKLLPWFRRRLFWRKYIVSLLITFIVGVIFALVMEVILPQEGQWSDHISHKCEEFCENSHMCDHTMEERPTVQQPVNAYSNMVYIWCGLVPLIFLRVDLSTIMYFCASAWLAIASFMFHASISKFWASMDGASMYTYGSVLIFHGLHCVFNISWGILTVLQVALFITMPLVRSMITIDSELIFSGQLVVVVILAVTLVFARIYKIINLGTARGKRDQLPCWLTSSSILWQSVRVFSIAFVQQSLLELPQLFG